MNGRLEGGPLQQLRVRGGVRLRFAAGPSGTLCARVHEADGYRVRFPVAGQCEALILNTGGGVAGGDSVLFDIAGDSGAQACISSVAAERIYRSEGEPARLDLRLRLASAARLAFLPQETILSSGARLDRRIEIDMADDACLTVCDMLVLGRRGHGEVMERGDIRDQWRIRRSGALVHREALRLDGAISETLNNPVTGAGCHVIATLLHCAPDAAEALESVRAMIPAEGPAFMAASAWDGRLVVRALAQDLADITPVLARIAVALSGFSLPRTWAV